MMSHRTLNQLLQAKTIFQVDFEGLTGHVAFDQRGQRRDYTLGVYELGLHYGPVQVGDSWSLTHEALVK